MDSIKKYHQQLELAIKEIKYGSNPKELYEPIDYIMSLGGKRMRPILVLMSCDLFDGDTAKAIHPALAIEIFHNFTLVHDDIMDNAPLRNDTALKVCEGQQMDMNYETQLKVSIPQYLKMIELKTAVLLAGALKIGALIGGAREEDAQYLYDFGKHIGIAFQLQDDILDVYAKVI